MRILLLITIFAYTNAHAGHTLGFEFESSLTKLTGVAKTDETEGVLLTNNNNNYKVNYSWSMNQFLKLMFNYGQKSFSFIDDDGIITNNDGFTDNVFDIGVKVVFASWGAFSFINKNDYDVIYSVNDSSQIVIEDGKINYLRLIYHQLLYNLRSILIVVDIIYDLPGNNNYIDTRSVFGAKGYLKMLNNGWGVDAFVQQINITKDNTEHDFSQTDTSLGLEFYSSF